MLKNSLKSVILVSFMAGVIHAENNVTIEEDITPAYWWEKSSYEYENSQILTHFEGSISHTQNSGNEDNEDTMINLKAKIRKGHFGASLNYYKRYEDHKVYDDKNDENPTHTLTDDYSSVTRVGYDINKNFYAVAGYENARNTSFEIYNQTTQYIGGGYRLNYDMYGSHRINLMLAVGNEDISFGTYPQLPSGETDGVYYNINYNFMMKSYVEFTANYSNFIADMDNRDTSKLLLKVTIPVFDNVSIVIGYIDEYMEAQETVDRYSNDETFFTAIKFEF